MRAPVPGRRRGGPGARQADVGGHDAQVRAIRCNQSLFYVERRSYTALQRQSRLGNAEWSIESGRFDLDAFAVLRSA